MKGSDHMSEMFGNLYGDQDKKSMPIGNFHFGIEIDSITECSFAKVSGVASEVEIYTYKEGGVNGYEHQIPSATKYSNITLEKGVTNSDFMYKWFKQISEGIIVKRNFAIILWDNSGKIIRRWNFAAGYPIKWSTSELDANGNSILIEKMELAHEGISEG